MTDTLTSLELADALWMHDSGRHMQRWKTASAVEAYVDLEAHQGHIVFTDDRIAWQFRQDGHVWQRLPGAVQPLGIDDYRAEVARLVDAHDGVSAEVWHSGGGIFGVRVEVGGLELFSTFILDGHAPSWTPFDCCDTEHNLVSTLELQVRPYDHPECYGTKAGTPEQMAEEILLFCKAVLDRGEQLSAHEQRAKSNAEIAADACHGLHEAITTALPNAHALLVDYSDQNTNDELTDCSIVDADENVIWVPFDPEYDDVDLHDLVEYLCQLDRYNRETWEQAFEDKPTMRLIVARLEDVSPKWTP